MPGLDDLLLPPGSRLVHIGPHKTGTTAIQAAFHTNRERIAEHGVHYGGPTQQAYRPALALTGRPGQRGTTGVAADGWTRLLEEIEGYGEDRVVISSESFSNADAESIQQLRDDLGPDRVQVVLMVRRYEAQLPSLWQQRVVGGYDRPWAGYVKRILTRSHHPFWRHFGLATLAGRWAEVVGPERVSVVVVDDGDRTWLPRVMEAMVGLPADTLRPAAGAGAVNRSLTWAEAEMLRATNGFFNRRGWSDAALRFYMRLGVKNALKPFAADPAEGRAAVPESLLPTLEELTRAHWADLQALGVRIVGELDWLLPRGRVDRADRAEREAAEPVSGPDLPLPVTKVAAAVASVVERAALAAAPPLTDGDGASLAPPPAPVAEPAAPRRRLRLGRRDGADALPAQTRALLDAVAAARTWSPEEHRRYVEEGLLPWLATGGLDDDPSAERYDVACLPARVAGLALSGVISRVPTA